MRIAILSPFYPFRGGLAQLNARLYTELKKANEVKAFTFTTLYPNFLFPGKTQFVTDDDPVTAIDSDRILSTINPFTYIQTARRINRYNPDILIIPYWMSFLAPAFGSVCLLLKKNIKVVSLVHNVFPHEKRFFDKAFTKFFLNRCHAYIVMSEPVRNDLFFLKKDANVLLQDHPIYDHYAEPIEKGLACRQLNMKSDKKNLLFFGLIRDYKGLDILIEAMSHLDDTYQLIIAGESYGSFDKYNELITNSPLKDNIIVFDHYINDDMVSVLFSASDLLVLPYRSATQSGVVALAYQLELPMVATDVGALGQTIKKSNTGIVVDEVTPQCVAKGIKDFFASDDQANFEANLKKEKIRLSWNNFTRSIESFLTAL